MIEASFTKAQAIAGRVGDYPAMADATATDVMLRGIDLTCRPLSAVLSAIPRLGWGALGNSGRLRLADSYRALQITSEVVRASAGIMPPCVTPGRLNGELREMGHDINYAWRVAEQASGQFDRIGSRVDPESIALMGLATVRAVQAWQGHQAAFLGGHEEFHATNLDAGLDQIDQTIASAFDR